LKSKIKQVWTTWQSYNLKQYSMATKKRIYVEKGETARMARLFIVTDQCIRNALRGLSSNELSDRIREEALRAGGVAVPQKRRVIKKEA
jgi:hypothetical protein